MAIATTSTIGNPSMTRVFSASSTEQVYSNQTDSVTQTAIGLSMPGQVVSYVCATVASGTGLWRIISSTTNKIHRQGFVSKTGYVDNMECMISPLTIQPDMLFQIYAQPDNAGANESNMVALVYTERGVEAFQATGALDAINAPLISIISGLGVGNLLFGATISKIAVAGEFGMALNNLNVVDAAGGTTYTGYGNYRLPTAGGTSTKVNGSFPMSIRIQKGWVVNVNPTTA